MFPWLLANSLAVFPFVLLLLVAQRVITARPGIWNALWALALLRLVLPPVVDWPWQFHPFPQEMVAAAPAPLPVDEEGRMRQMLALAYARVEGAPASHAVPAAGETEAKEAAFDWRLPLLAAWGCGALFVGLRGLLAIRRFRRLAQRGLPADGALLREVDRVAGRLRCRPPGVRVLAGLLSPLVWVFGRPTLYWPAGLESRLGESGRRAVLTHELAHLRRGDHWMRRLEIAAGLLHWWNPLYWIVRAQLRRTSELACDGWVVQTQPGAKRTYAEALLEVSRGWTAADPVPALGIRGGSERELERRLAMIMLNDGTPRRGRRAALTVGLLGLLVLPGWSFGQAEKEDGKEPEKAVVIEGVIKEDDLAAQWQLLFQQAERVKDPAATAPATEAPEGRQNAEGRLDTDRKELQRRVAEFEANYLREKLKFHEAERRFAEKDGDEEKVAMAQALIEAAKWQLQLRLKGAAPKGAVIGLPLQDDGKGTAVPEKKPEALRPGSGTSTVRLSRELDGPAVKRIAIVTNAGPAQKPSGDADKKSGEKAKTEEEALRKLLGNLVDEATAKAIAQALESEARSKGAQDFARAPAAQKAGESNGADPRVQAQIEKAKAELQAAQARLEFLRKQKSEKAKAAEPTQGTLPGGLQYWVSPPQVTVGQDPGKTGAEAKAKAEKLARELAGKLATLTVRDDKGEKGKTADFYQGTLPGGFQYWISPPSVTVGQDPQKTAEAARAQAVKLARELAGQLGDPTVAPRVATIYVDGTNNSARFDVKGLALPNVVGVPAAPVEALERAVYTLPGKAASIAKFIRENVKAKTLEITSDADKLTVTTDPKVQKVIGQFVGLMVPNAQHANLSLTIVADATAKPAAGAKPKESPQGQKLEPAKAAPMEFKTGPVELHFEMGTPAAKPAAPAKIVPDTKPPIPKPVGETKSPPAPKSEKAAAPFEYFGKIEMLELKGDPSAKPGDKAALEPGVLKKLVDAGYTVKVDPKTGEWTIEKAKK